MVSPLFCPTGITISVVNKCSKLSTNSWLQGFPRWMSSESRQVKTGLWMGFAKNLPRRWNSDNSVGWSFLKIFYFFTAVLGSHQNWEEVARISHTHHPTQALPPVNILHESGVFVKINDPTLSHHNHPKSIVHLRIHSWCCTFYRFAQMYNDMYPSLHFHAEYIHFLKSPLCSIYSLLSPVLYSPWQPMIFLLYRFFFSWMSHNWNHTVCSFFRLSSFALRFFHVSMAWQLISF